MTAAPPTLRHHLPKPESVARIIRGRGRIRPALGLVLGSGFQEATRCLKVEVEIPYARLRGFPQPGVGGHAGKLLIGRLAGTAVAVLSGRAHFYEGHAMETVTFPMRVLAALGVRDVLLTNAAGGINRRFRPGDFMMLTDHINLMGANPLRGPVAAGRARFVDLSEVYGAGLRRVLQRAARAAKVSLRTGVYLAVSGPSYETPAEIRAFARLGADAVGMSTVPEAIVARQCGLGVAGLSCITNLAAGLARAPISHAEVLEIGARVKHQASALLEAFASLYGRA